MGQKDQGLFDDIIDFTARYHWRVGVSLAIVAYLALHLFANMEIPSRVNITDFEGAAIKPILKAAAIVGQYFIPMLFSLGALSSVLARRRRKALHANVANAGVRSALEKMSWREFEELVGEFFRRRGYSVRETGGGGPDGGMDLVLSRGTDRYLVQCKQWKAFQVGVAIVRELYGVMAAESAAGGFVVTSGVFTDEARRFAEGREIQLIAGDQLVEMIRAAQGGMKRAGDARELPACPQCGSEMVLRTARKGTSPGQSFWGCSTYPKCHGTRPA
jgi:restriction system protein